MPQDTRLEGAEANATQEFKAPQVSSDELSVFFEAHFSNEAVLQFGSSFLNLNQVLASNDTSQVYQDLNDEEDDLGYYADGVKRTLTDEQIEIFRHSELQGLLREKRRAARKGNDKQVAEAKIPACVLADETSSGVSESALPSMFKSSKKRRKGFKIKAEPKPDLRKRTWDVVEAGLDSLNYD